MGKTNNSGVCKVVGNVILVVGTLGSIAMAVGIPLEDAFFLKLVTFLVGLFFSVAQAVIFYALAEILDNVGELIFYNKEIIKTMHNNSNNSQPSAPVNEGKSSLLNNNNLNSGDWKCKRCGKVNRSYVASCLCGQEKNKNN